MATIAQIKRERLLQLKRVIAALRKMDTKQEMLQRTLNRYRTKRKVIESEDIQPLFNQFREMVATVNGVETELNNLGKLTAM